MSLRSPNPSPERHQPAQRRYVGGVSGDSAVWVGVHVGSACHVAEFYQRDVASAL